MDIGSLELFVRVVELGSYRAAAEATGAPRSTLRRRIEALEAELGAELLNRGATLTPTPAGERLVAEAEELLRRARGVAGRVRGTSSATGTLRVVAPIGLPPQLLTVVAGRLVAANPELQVELAFAEDPLQALGPHVDMVAHFGAILPHGPYVTRVFMTMPHRLVASRAYLAERGEPATVEALSDHALLCWRPAGTDTPTLPLRTGAARQITPRFSSPDVHVVRSMAAMGMGIALAPDAPIAASELPDLVPVLDGEVGTEVALRLVVPEARTSSTRVRAVLDLLGTLA